jgi:hypothetical protein
LVLDSSISPRRPTGIRASCRYRRARVRRWQPPETAAGNHPDPSAPDHPNRLFADHPKWRFAECRGPTSAVVDIPVAKDCESPLRKPADPRRRADRQAVDNTRIDSD